MIVSAPLELIGRREIEPLLAIRVCQSVESNPEAQCVFK